MSESKTPKTDAAFDKHKDCRSTAGKSCMGQIKIEMASLENELASTQSLLKEREKEVAMLRCIAKFVYCDGKGREFYPINLDNSPNEKFQQLRQYFSECPDYPYIPLSIVEPVIQALESMQEAFDSDTARRMYSNSYNGDNWTMLEIGACSDARSALIQYKQAINKE